jgi:proteasome lid subunit RPN8/RPN11
LEKVLSKMTAKIECPESVVEETLAVLRSGGVQNCEAMVLWLSERGQSDPTIVTEVYVPEQQVAVDYFCLSASSVRILMRHLKDQKLRIVAQVHSHPGPAFHSDADNEWAIVRHEGAVSIVVPNFARGVNVQSFFGHSATFKLTASDSWAEVAKADLQSVASLRPC